MTHLPRPTLRALRSVVARALGVRRSRVRIVDRAHPVEACDDVRCVVVRAPGRVTEGVAYVARGDGAARPVVRYITRRARSCTR